MTIEKSSSERITEPEHSHQSIESPEKKEPMIIGDLLSDGEPDLIEYAEALCLYRMVAFGHFKDDGASERLINISNQFKFFEGRQELPEKFQKVKDVLMRIIQKQDFEKALEEIRSA